MNVLVMQSWLSSTPIWIFWYRESNSSWIVVDMGSLYLARREWDRLSVEINIRLSARP